MPILPLEPFLYPHNLFADTPWEAGEERWWVLHTRPRAEKSLARRLLTHGNGFFLPLHQRRWLNKARKFESHVPLFPGYVFLHGTQDARLAALATNLVVNVLTVTDQSCLHEDLSRVHHLMVSGAPLTPEQTLMPGAPVEIVAGPFAGLHGKFLRRAGACRLFIEVSFLQCGVSVEIEPWMMQPLGSSRLSLSPA
ncbi:MAG: hypothetical protein L0Y72_30575 [Gemmataceae bacterium]|nr:hypothetical protein [Gemmataceae bacterium]MCI0743393.1 hypothetical protein [Gemmataceae bacterium]